MPFMNTHQVEHVDFQRVVSPVSSSIVRTPDSLHITRTGARLNLYQLTADRRYFSHSIRMLCTLRYDREAINDPVETLYADCSLSIV